MANRSAKTAASKHFRGKTPTKQPLTSEGPTMRPYMLRPLKNWMAGERPKLLWWLKEASWEAASQPARIQSDTQDPWCQAEVVWERVLISNLPDWKHWVKGTSSHRTEQGSQIRKESEPWPPTCARSLSAGQWTFRSHEADLLSNANLRSMFFF